jgi:hypothetical protein
VRNARCAEPPPNRPGVDTMNRSPKPDPRKIEAVPQWFIHRGIGHAVTTWTAGRPVVYCHAEVLPGYHQAETPPRICADCRASIQFRPLPGARPRRPRRPRSPSLFTPPLDVEPTP